MEEEKTRSWELDANKIIMKQLEILQDESKKEETTASEKVVISQSMANLYSVVINLG